ncbi:hypothetical protein PN441_05800 [Spirulina major CS-329]|uniref:hypothetical protein n=1 Tax=Spirulina TaxID=1154 RepID=UPI00232E0E53|nr:hypothetical protein [Spirulina subsalsa]MDB9493487.1 hypothetical protein [Spirulina subsalsa CS-330]MDB9502580.1 hypothetical protein [Spirulina major CS-329]
MTSCQSLGWVFNRLAGRIKSILRGGGDAHAWPVFAALLLGGIPVKRGKSGKILDPKLGEYPPWWDIFRL